MKNIRKGNSKIKIILIILLSVLTLLLFLKQRNIKKESENFPSKIEIIFEEKNEIYQKLIDGRDIIQEKYIMSETEEKTFYSLEFKPKDTSRKNFIKERFLEDIQIISKEEQEKIKIVDFTESKKNLQKYYYGFIFLFEIAVLIFLAVYLIRSVKLNIKRYKIGTKRKYGKEFLLENLTMVLLEILKLVLLIFLWVFLLRLILEFKLSTPSRFLPPEDIFDFQFYSNIGNVFKEEYGKTAGGYGEIYINLMEITKKYFVKSVALLIALLSVSISYIREKFKVEEKDSNKLQIEGGELDGNAVV